ncbi:competence protein ComEA helix-hairpin-helix repeat region [Enterococcus faecium EnGen0372]|uniref:Tex family protein n=1 Tax=Enterococcus faecium TaxID=1352 RepID=UPI00032D82F5|nr:Tex family protein [Enterococcus faecium]EOG03881.1 competence protein ComEA helix-hairpin-helix repeat region [Enterococcus faecium EnGen0171]EOK12629.1 competence protein ComEA helix-hairpin-helix repeat region [Enterococcus faecium EnGen0372]EOM39347.1 competence protein ComEA helix-hairpin-helix repeat region [Enterococcus faecium EnGen0172]MDT2317454.1 Tex family protein [Enterococcus faecium]NMP65015.1 RNA-binding transcriptional accessory protein [Enterococcus faecium]
MTENLNQTIIQLVQKELSDYRPKQLTTVLNLLNEGNTVPFIARYRKEMTGSLDEVQIREIEERYAYLENLEKRKTEVIRLIDEQGKLTPELEAEITQAVKMQQVEDLYRPYKQKRRTKATIAKEKGLEPLAKWLMQLTDGEVQSEAEKYIDKEKEVSSAEEALHGAHEIIAEQVSDNAKFRTWIRSYTYNKGMYVSNVKDEQADEKGVYEMYYDFAEPVHKMVSHRILATNRGEKEDILKVFFQVDEAAILAYLDRQIVKNPASPSSSFVREAYQDSYKRFIQPAIERELRNELTEKADEQAIAIFGENLRNLLLQPPLKGKVVLGFDPAYRTGCKLAVVDATGKVLAIEVIYPHKPATQAKREAAGPAFIQLINKYQVDMVAIGNGTASRESELFVAEQLKSADHKTYYAIVNEAGASVYSASEIARKEFPHLQVEERSAVSIARRLQDPLAELVKIDPKAVGVGQYQHDVSQKRLAEQLDFVVETAVNQVGVDVNTASPQLLQHISGLNKTTAQNIVIYREENGEFTARTQLKKVPRLGPKAYEQAIGFLRVPGGKNILDNTGIHPESYSIAEEILTSVQLSEKELGTEEAVEKLTRLSVEKLAESLSVGEETLTDILAGLTQPGRDMRDEMPAPLLRTDVLSMEDLKPGMELTGTVRNVIDFGAFVDIGVKQDGLVHISKLSKKFVKHPTDVVSVGDIVTVWIEQVDTKKGRISLTMLSPYEE